MSKEKKYRIGTYLILIPAILFLFPKVYAQHESKTINDSWKFYQGECKAAASATYDDSAWNSIHLPHTWNTDAYTEKKVLPGNRLVSPYTDITEKLANQTGIPETGCSQ